MNASLDQSIKECKAANRWQDLINLLQQDGKAKPEVWNSAWYISQLGFAWSQAGKNDKARYCYKRWLELEAQSARPYYCLGYLSYDEQNWTEAIEWFDKALEIDPLYVVCLYRKGVALQHQFKYGQSAKILKKAITLWQDNDDPQWQKRNRKTYYRSIFNLGKACHNERHYAQAIRCFTKVIEEEKFGYIEKAIKIYNLSKACFGNREYARAREILQPLLNQHRTCVWEQDLMGRILLAEGRPEEAIQAFTEALRIRAFSYVFQNRAQAWLAKGQPNKAQQDLQQALKRDRKGKHKILLQLGKLEVKKKQHQQAIDLFQRAIAFKKRVWDVDYAEAHLALADVYRQMGDAEKQKSEMRRAREIDPGLDWRQDITININRLN